MNDLPIVTLGLILLTASLVAMFTRQVKLPYSVGLVVAGIVLAPFPGDRTCRSTESWSSRPSCRR